MCTRQNELGDSHEQIIKSAAIGNPLMQLRHLHTRPHVVSKPGNPKMPLHPTAHLNQWDSKRLCQLLPALCEKKDKKGFSNSFGAFGHLPTISNNSLKPHCAELHKACRLRDSLGSSHWHMAQLCRFHQPSSKVNGGQPFCHKISSIRFTTLKPWVHKISLSLDDPAKCSIEYSYTCTNAHI